MQLRALRLPAVGAALLLSGAAAAYPLNPWGAQTPQGYVAVNPFLYVYSGPSFYPILYGATGLSDSMDLIAGAGGYVYTGGGGGGFDYVEAIPRYWLSDTVGLTLHLIYAAPSSDSYAANAIMLAPEVHGVLGGDSFALTYNAGWRPWVGFGGGGFSPGEVVAYLAPEYNFSSQFSLFLEVDPSFALGGGDAIKVGDRIGLLLVPGVGFALDEEQTHTFAVGAQIDALSDPAGDFVGNNLSFGMWYATGFGG